MVTPRSLLNASATASRSPSRPKNMSTSEPGLPCHVLSEGASGPVGVECTTTEGSVGFLFGLVVQFPAPVDEFGRPRKNLHRPDRS